MTIIANGTIIDGTGRPAFPGDVAVEGDRIADIVPGGIAAKGDAQVVDASGCLVTPGFVDAHAHSDAYLVLEPDAPSKLSQGITTEINGQSGGLRDREIKAEHESSGAVDVAKFTSVKLRVTNIKFNHDTSSSNHDAINIRRCFEDSAGKIDVSNGEWFEDGGVVTNEPFCYTTNRAATVKARFEASGFITSAVIRATCAGAGGSLSSLLPTNIAFSGGVSSPEYVEFAMSSRTLGCIDRSGGGVLNWSADSVNGQSGCKMNDSGPHLVYTILGEPKPPWANDYGNQKNAWTNALEFAIVKAGAQGKNTDKAALAAITTYLHSGHGLTYDIGVATNAIAGAGRPKYMSSTAGVIEFRLTEYMNKSSLKHNTSGNVVNCYDQAGGVATLARLFGVNAHCRFMMPFGYINPLNLVGEGMCNNPFYPLYNNEKLTGVDLVEPERSRFLNHMFVSLSGKVFDACAGPQLGSLDEVGYVSVAIDVSTTSEANAAGTISNIYTTSVQVVK